MTDVGELVLRIRADAAQLEREMKRANGIVRESSSEMGGALDTLKDQFKELVPALTAAAVVEFAKGALEAADNLYIMAQRTGFASDTLSKLNIPLKQNGSSVDEFASSMKFLSRNIEQAAEGNPALIATFTNLGLSVTKLKELSPEQQFYAVADAMSKVADQGQFTNDGMTIMGRGFASIAPLIKSAAGNMADFVSKMDGLTKEQIDKVHEYDDAWISFWEHGKIYIVDYLTYFDKLGEKTREWIDELRGIEKLPQNASYNRPEDVNQATFLPKGNTSLGDEANRRISDSLKARGLTGLPDTSALGNNSDLVPEATNQLGDYIKGLQDEAEALSKSQLALAEYKAEKEGATKAAEDFKNGLRGSPELTDEEKQKIDAATEAYMKQKQAIEDLRREEDKHAQMVAQMESQISSSLADIALNYKSLGATISSVLQQIAKQILEMQVTTPLVEAIGGTKNSPGLLSGLFSSLSSSFGGFFADGGDPPVGVPSVIGENGPEIFVPKTAGTVIPNGKLGGSTVIVQQTINMQPGLAETVGAAVRSAAPAIAAQAQQGVFAAMRRGGNESQIAGLRS